MSLNHLTLMPTVACYDLRGAHQSSRLSFMLDCRGARLLEDRVNVRRA
ncbi:hypothetical protein CCHR01_18328 [Colletotrichum chrysophilum]|uniref:Uncharacterized protein n=1 Tax=Colletotrichum chrysophilum TaxID=1836956 RepID=A0AAD9A4R8_9PEZI|nr:hypothetical protein CCHR01_18328 [Colletotrichum chrysophilum]